MEGVNEPDVSSSHMEIVIDAFTKRVECVFRGEHLHADERRDKDDRFWRIRAAHDADVGYANAGG